MLLLVKINSGGEKKEKRPACVRVNKHSLERAFQEADSAIWKIDLELKKLKHYFPALPSTKTPRAESRRHLWYIGTLLCSACSALEVMRWHENNINSPGYRLNNAPRDQTKMHTVDLPKPPKKWCTAKWPEAKRGFNNIQERSTPPCHITLKLVTLPLALLMAPPPFRSECIPFMSLEPCRLDPATWCPLTRAGVQFLSGVVI